MKYGICWKLKGCVPENNTVYSSIAGRRYDDLMEALKTVLKESAIAYNTRNFVFGVYETDTSTTIKTDFMDEGQKVILLKHKETTK